MVNLDYFVLMLVVIFGELVENKDGEITEKLIEIIVKED